MRSCFYGNDDMDDDDDGGSADGDGGDGDDDDRWWQVMKTDAEGIDELGYGSNYYSVHDSGR